jgi:hypothetical protein
LWWAQRKKGGKEERTNSHHEIDNHRWIVREEEVKQSSDDGDGLKVVSEKGERPRKGEEGHWGSSARRLKWAKAVQG